MNFRALKKRRISGDLLRGIQKTSKTLNTVRFQGNSRYSKALKVQKLFYQSNRNHHKSCLEENVLHSGNIFRWKQAFIVYLSIEIQMWCIAIKYNLIYLFIFCIHFSFLSHEELESVSVTVRGSITDKDPLSGMMFQRW